jgi:hypothetical protein
MVDYLHHHHFLLHHLLHLRSLEWEPSYFLFSFDNMQKHQEAILFPERLS